MIPLAAAGLLSMLAQVVVLRELVAALYGVDLIYVLALAAWMIGTAAGAAAGRLVPPRPGVLSLVFVALGVLTPLGVAFVRTSGVAVGAVPGAYLPFAVQMMGICAATLPGAALCGLAFQVAASIAASGGRSLARSYAIESAGAVAGGALVTLCFHLEVSTWQVAIVTAAIAMTAAAAPAGRRRPWRFGAGVLLLAAAGSLLIARVTAWDAGLLRWQYPSLVAARDTPYARVAVTRMGQQFAVFQNGAFAADTEGTSADAFADLAALQHPGPRRALVFGGTVEGIAVKLAAHGFARIDVVELDERGLDLIEHLTGPSAHRPGSGQVVAVTFDDARAVLDRPGADDLIVIATPEPTSGETSRFYTQEFFARCARRLGPRGVLALRLPASENFWTPPLARRTAGIYHALRREFRAVEVIPGATLYLVASQAPLSIDAGVFAARLAARHVAPRVMTPAFLNYLYQNDRRAEVRALLEATRVPPDRDSAPVSYRYSTMMWLSKFYPRLAVMDVPSPWMRRAGSASAALAAVLFLAWLRLRPSRRGWGFVLGAGLSGMLLETVLLLRYQMTRGVVYQDLGWLLMCFMGGLAIGACAIGGRVPPGCGDGRARRASATIAGGLVVLSLCVWAATWIERLGGLAGVSILLGAAGVLVGSAFGCAAARRPPGNGGRAAANLYAADLAGGALGAVAATLFLVPQIGLDGTALVSAALGLLLLGLV